MVSWDPGVFRESVVGLGAPLGLPGRPILGEPRCPEDEALAWKREEELLGSSPLTVLLAELCVPAAECAVSEVPLIIGGGVGLLLRDHHLWDLLAP
jgi:hypothetical protein